MWIEENEEYENVVAHSWVHEGDFMSITCIGENLKVWEQDKFGSLRKENISSRNSKRKTK